MHTTPYIIELEVCEIQQSDHASALLFAVPCTARAVTGGLLINQEKLLKFHEYINEGLGDKNAHYACFLIPQVLTFQ